ncbi:hypothetical protein [Conyzicola sp.]|uniref:hypothetical protein n=1 Tax=Conyzicola sp. TaxID=1969404 RepID=UPI003989D6A2
MPSDNAVDALRRHRAAESKTKKASVLTALENAKSRSENITIAGIARAAKVSREFIHSHAVLHDAIAAAALELRHNAERASTTQTLANGRGLKADRATLLSRVERDKAVIAGLQQQVTDLSSQRKRWLGSQLDAPGKVDPEVHAELRISYERLLQTSRTTEIQLTESRRLVQVLEDDLSNLRQAYSEEIRRLSAGASTNVTSIERAKSDSD